MSDSKSSYGDPVEEPRPVDDVVGSAHEGIADAEAAGRNAVVSDETAAHETPVEAASDPVVEKKPATVSEPMVDEDPAFDSAMYEAHADDATTAYPAQTTVAPAAVAPAADAYIAPSEPVADAYVAPAAAAGTGAAVAYAPQPIFVQAPESPRPRGNRAAAGAIGLLAALCFGILYLAVWIGIGLISGEVVVGDILATALVALGTWALWVPVVVFFIAFWLLGAIINRGRWGRWVIFGLLVGVVSYGGYILGQLFEAPFWRITASEAVELVDEQLLAPLAIAAFVFARELTIWFGAWVARSGARKTELNAEAQREYERTLEAGPTLSR